MRTKVITAPTVEPISLTEAKTHLRVDFSEDDAYIGALISAARNYAEGYQRRSLAEQTLELTTDCFTSPIQLTQPPIVSVVSVKYRDVDGIEVTIPAADYIVGTESETVIPASGNSWPTELYPVDAVKIRYSTGYSSLTVPKSTKQAILLLVGHWYENREAVVIGKTPTKLPFAVESLLQMDRTW